MVRFEYDGEVVDTEQQQPTAQQEIDLDDVDVVLTTDNGDLDSYEKWTIIIGVGTLLISSVSLIKAIFKGGTE